MAYNSQVIHPNRANPFVGLATEQKSSEDIQELVQLAAPMEVRFDIPERTGSTASDTAQVTVLQHFVNSSLDVLQAKFVFPLPEKCAIDGLRCYVDGKVIDGVVKRKEEANQQYEKAIASGKQAFKLEQDGQNLFALNLGNLPPKSDVSPHHQDTLTLSGDY